MNLPHCYFRSKLQETSVSSRSVSPDNTTRPLDLNIKGTSIQLVFFYFCPQLPERFFIRSHISLSMGNAIPSRAALRSVPYRNFLLSIAIIFIFRRTHPPNVQGMPWHRIHRALSGTKHSKRVGVDLCCQEKSQHWTQM